jgi:hypothetical protein
MINLFLARPSKQVLESCFRGVPQRTARKDPIDNFENEIYFAPGFV